MQNVCGQEECVTCQSRILTLVEFLSGQTKDHPSCVRPSTVEDVDDNFEGANCSYKAVLRRLTIPVLVVQEQRKQQQQQNQHQS